MIRIRRGLDLPISGQPNQPVEGQAVEGQAIEDGPGVSRVALVGYDHPGLKPTMAVREGDAVKAGQVVFTDKKSPGVKYTAPASGKVVAVNRGPRRIFESLVIEVDGGVAGHAANHAANHATSHAESFAYWPAPALRDLPRDKVVENLVESGQWVAIRTRPYSKVPLPGDSPEAIFITAADTRPGAPHPRHFIAAHGNAWLHGIDVISRLTDGDLHICSMAGSGLPVPDNTKARMEEFSGPHPAGNAGTHIHHLHPVHTNRAVWHIGYQDVIAIGYLFTTGKLFFERLVALSGPSVSNPRLARTRLGACTDELMAGELKEGNQRVVSGSVLDGRHATGATAYLGRFHNQVSALEEGTERELLEFVMPGASKFSLTRLFISAFSGRKSFDLTTSTGGSQRSIIPLGTYEEVMPLDILPTQLLRALVVDDFDAAVDLGCLELDEEDLALCTFACPGKYEYGPYLRRMLDRIEAEG